MRTDIVYAEPYPQEVYCRLSNDDDLSDPSASIQNQRELLCRYCEEQGWRVAGIFQDDGYTGLSMERPDFQKMLAAVETEYKSWWSPISTEFAENATYSSSQTRHTVTKAKCAFNNVTASRTREKTLCAFLTRLPASTATPRLKSAVA